MLIEMFLARAPKEHSMLRYYVFSQVHFEVFAVQLVMGHVPDRTVLVPIQLYVAVTWHHSRQKI